MFSGVWVGSQLLCSQFTINGESRVAATNVNYPIRVAASLSVGGDWVEIA